MGHPVLAFAYFNFNETDRFNPSRVALTSYFPQVEETIQDGQMRGWRRQLMCGQQGTLFNYHFSDVIDNTLFDMHVHTYYLLRPS